MCVEDRGNQERYPFPEAFLQSLPHFTRHVPAMDDKYGVHHTKMALLTYENGIRVAIFTNNFIEQDWKCKSNGIFLQDFPHGHGKSPLSTHQFGPCLAHYLDRLGCTEWSGRICKYDYSNARGALVPSVPGKHTGTALKRFGQLRLRYLQSTANKRNDRYPTSCTCRDALPGKSWELNLLAHETLVSLLKSS